VKRRIGSGRAVATVAGRVDAERIDDADGWGRRGAVKPAAERSRVGLSSRSKADSLAFRPLHTESAVLVRGRGRDN
jgi:hypothetical protein